MKTRSKDGETVITIEHAERKALRNALWVIRSLTSHEKSLDAVASGLEQVLSHTDANGTYTPGLIDLELPY